MLIQEKRVKPFLKWAGGKGQLLEQISGYLPSSLKTGKIKKYFEPFLGGGALFFWLVEKYEFEKSYLFEINPSLNLCYQVIKNSVEKLIKELNQLEFEYFSFSDDGKEKYFYERRSEFNTFIQKKSINHVTRRAALLIFLNKTCFNGLYRVNSKGEFNVPFGRYKNPTICSEDNLFAVNEALQNAEIISDDFSSCLKYADGDSFVYFDPPYRPLSETSSFTSYSKDIFDDLEQKRLRKIFGELDIRGADVMLSNSDPKNANPKDNFFDDLYRGYNIKRLNAMRLINCNSEKRGVVKEILVRNYD